jgi:hypothetical protein
MTPNGSATVLRIGHATAARRARQRTARPPGNTWMNFVIAPMAFKFAGDEADGPHSQYLHDPPMEESHGISDQIHRISD